jgi:16S rRNA (guanine966-N2)-methyltransferase
MASNTVRIIGGKWRGRKLRFPDAPDLRPTLGRVRETVFNWLRDPIEGARCLDLFAGSGALGFEALSRGAASVTFVDSRREVVRRLRDNATLLGAEDVTLICSRADRLLRQPHPPWDVIFVDPPFDEDALPAVLTAVAGNGLLAPDGLIYYEASRHRPLTLSPWREVKQAFAGETRFGLLATP